MAEAELNILEDPEEVAEQAATLLSESLWERPGPAVCLPAGQTPRLLYALLREKPDALRASGAVLFQLDEIVGAAPDKPPSFAHFLSEELLQPLEWSANAHLLDGSARDTAAEIRQHAEKLQLAGGLDVAVLGLGTNGHIAFNEPGSVPEDHARVVALAESTRDALASPALGIEYGITLGLHEILAARRILLMVTGESKASALRRALEEPQHPVCPASYLRSHSGLVILADSDACAELSV